MTVTATLTPPAPPTGRDDAAPRAPRRRKRFSLERTWPYLFIAPAILVIVLVRLVPLALGANFSFTGDGALNGAFVGFDNYVRLFQDKVFLDSLRNVLVLLLFLPIAVAVPGLLATFLFLQVPGHRFYRSVYFMPVVLSPIIIGAIFNIVLAVNGPVNEALAVVGIDGPDWLGERNTALISVILVHIWATFGMSLVIFMAGFSTLDQSLLDAARVDGANLPQTVWHVIIPELSRTIQFVFVTTMIGLLTSMFGLLYMLTGGGPGSASYLPELFIWTQQGTMNQPAYASAASMILFLIMLVVGFVQIRLLRQTTKDES
jgi:multiple sugar transport system permease protein